ncbi:hypothetical protein BUALT_Bualt03G0166300 [Buddleja alternifolia]|uniref:RING-type E3 ubiquitin transferase n=1 Tax=Buddleja alternifolia TaxID=168488 RepID=A0AAV6XVB9_9LAMI|nr:hypothetical protein BUALT_Bualt03G0166300 [Buddleja alternifolia]
MAVEARHLNPFPSQALGNRDLMMNTFEGFGNVYGAPIGYGVVAPSSGTTTATVPMYGSAITDTFPTKSAAIKSDSGLTYAVPLSRKRSRDAINNPLLSSLIQNQSANNNNHSRCGSNFTFLGEDMSFHFQQQQLETEKVRLEIEERRKRYSRRIAAAVEENVMKKLKAKEEEMEKIGKMNWALEERVKSLCVENQIWKDLAQTNEATANALRCNLEQVLQAQVEDENRQEQRHLLDDDAQSCCGSNFDDEVMERRTSANSTGGHDREYNNSDSRMCRRCGREESCVLLLPCRHLCLCTVCGSSLNTCPVCKATKTASVHVNLSYSS